MTLEFAIQVRRPVQLASGDPAPAGSYVRIEGRARECLRLVRDGFASVDFVDGSGLHLATPPKLVDGEPATIDALKKRLKEVLLKKAQELALTSAEPPPAGKSWFDVAAEQRWSKITAKREQDAAAEEAAHVELRGHFEVEAKQQEAEAEAALVRAKALREQATKAAEFVSFESAEHALSIARDTFETFEKIKDPRANVARERLAMAEAKFAEAKLARDRYAARVKLGRLQDKLNPLGVPGSLFPKPRLAEALEVRALAQNAIEADDFSAFDSITAELAELLEPPQEASQGTISRIGGFAL